MSKYFAELDEKGLVIRVVVCDNLAWLTSRLKGTWVETKINDPTEKYAGIGTKCDPGVPAKFIPDPEKPATVSKPIDVK